jgi:hypothetical protein
LKSPIFLGFLSVMRLWFALSYFILLPLLHGGSVPAELQKALKDFRAEGTRGWSFVQTTVAGSKSLVEHFTPAKPETLRWTLLKKDGRDPTPGEKKDYEEKLTRHSRGETAPNVKDNLDLDSCELVADEGERVRYRFKLKPGGGDDKSAAFMASTFTLHRPTGTIERVELASTQPFSPMFAVKIESARTVISYTLPDADRPTLLKDVSVSVRGRAMWIRSLDEDMTVTYSDYEYAGKKPAPLPAGR